MTALSIALSIALKEHLRKMGIELDDDYLRPGVEWLMQQLIEMEACIEFNQFCG